MDKREIATSGFAVWNGDESGWDVISEDCVLHDSNQVDPLDVGDLIAHHSSATASDGSQLHGIAVNRQRDDQVVESWIVTAAN